MAREAGIYESLWRPEEINKEKAEDIIYLNACKEYPKCLIKISR